MSAITYPPCLRRIEPTRPLCAGKGQQPLQYVSAQHTATEGVLAQALKRRRAALSAVLATLTVKERKA